MCEVVNLERQKWPPSKGGRVLIYKGVILNICLFLGFVGVNHPRANWVCLKVPCERISPGNFLTLVER